MEDKNRPLVSIVIPTYNRYVYLQDCVEATRSVDSDELEIIIQDNSTDNTEFKKYIDSLNDTRVKYYYKPEHVSVVDNCDMACRHATGKYLCMIGDDDTVCSSIIKAAHYLEENGVDGCCFPFPGFYWPDMNFKKGAKIQNMFFRTEATGTIYPIDTLQQIKDYACCGILGDKMPRLYHAMVSKDCIDRIWAKVGTYFPGPSPDMASAVATCLEAKKSVWIDDYLMVSGYGNLSARGQSQRNEHFGKIKDMWWLPKDTADNWDKNTPPLFSGETIFSQSAICALKTMGADKAEYRFDYSGLYATFFWQHRSVRIDLLLFILRSPKRIYWFLKGVFNKVKSRFRRIGTKEHNFLDLHDVATLAEAQQITEEKSRKLKYKPIVEVV